MADNNKKKENFFKRAGKGIVNYCKATKSELKKVSWPSRKQLINNTIIVVVCVVIVGVIIALLDSIFGLGFNFIINREDTSSDAVVEEATEEYSLSDEEMEALLADYMESESDEATDEAAEEAEENTDDVWVEIETESNEAE